MIELLRRLLFLPPGASSVSDEIDWLHASVITAAMLLCVWAFAKIAYFVFRYRRRNADATERLELSFRRELSVIGFITFAFLVWWLVGFRQYAAMTAPPADADTVFVEAKQWMWKFSYPDGRETEDVLVVPAGRPIKLVMSSRDVIHSFFVPDFRLKQDVVPGRFSTMWFRADEPGRHPIWCAEYCGVSHSMMRGEVQVLSQEDYANWLRERGGVDIVARGREVAEKWACASCHSLDGAPRTGPTWKGLYGSERTMTDGRHIVADEAYLTRSMAEPNVEIVQGYKPVMPAYQGTLPPADAAAIVALIRSLREVPP